MRRITFIFMLAIALFLGDFNAPARASDLVNYENDPDLAAAMGYDSEMNGGNRQVASQHLAEQHYLVYLQRAQSADQRARVYVQLGVLFSTNWHKEAGEKPDYFKARTYFQEALNCAPDRVGIPMIQARLGMATPLQSREERLSLRLETYRWLNSVDVQQARAHWLRSKPNEVPSDNDVAAEVGVLRNVQLAEQDNIIDEARKSQDPFRSLQKVSDAFPGTDLGNAAAQLRQSVLRKMVDPMLGRSIATIEKDMPAANRAAQQPLQQSVPLSHSEPRRYSLSSAFALAAGILALAALCAFHFLKHRRPAAQNR